VNRKVRSRDTTNNRRLGLTQNVNESLATQRGLRIPTDTNAGRFAQGTGGVANGALFVHPMDSFIALSLLLRGGYPGGRKLLCAVTPGRRRGGGR
jgi:hypothetical protein